MKERVALSTLLPRFCSRDDLVRSLLQHQLSQFLFLLLRFPLLALYFSLNLQLTIPCEPPSLLFCFAVLLYLLSELEHTFSTRHPRRSAIQVHELSFDHLLEKLGPADLGGLPATLFLGSTVWV
jgi:hypothetical protein